MSLRWLFRCRYGSTDECLEGAMRTADRRRRAARAGRLQAMRAAMFSLGIAVAGHTSPALAAVAQPTQLAQAEPAGNPGVAPAERVVPVQSADPVEEPESSPI